MLLEFKTKNYKSFKEEMVFSMIPDAETKGLDYSILKKTAGGREYQGLCSAVIYGPNAAGKTNLIGAIDVLRNIILRGHIRNAEQNSPNAAASNLELIPNHFDTQTEPVSFEIRFIAEGFLIEYTLVLALGEFSDETYSRKILLEELKVNGDMIFSRGEELRFGNFDPIEALLTDAFAENADSAKALAQSSLDVEELFITHGFKIIFSTRFVELFTEWFGKQLTIIYSANIVRTVQKFEDAKRKSIYVERSLNDAAKCFGIGSNAIAYVIDEDGLEAKLCSIFEKENRKLGVSAESFESYGTLRFINMFPLIARVLAIGGTLVVDEFDASIHPMALMNIVNIFHNDEINIHQAQLIFNTHNPIFLNGNLYRADEIKFVERDEETQYSEQYALSDFEAEEINEDRDYMKNYFVSRYGAVREIDFSPVFKELLYEGKGE